MTTYRVRSPRTWKCWWVNTFLMIVCACSDKTDGGDTVPATDSESPSVLHTGDTNADSEDSGTSVETDLGESGDSHTGGDSNSVMDTGETGETTDSEDTVGGGDTGDTDEPEYPLSSDKYIDIGARTSSSCGIKEDYTVTCWGESVFTVDIPPPSGSFSKMSSDGHCLLGLDDGSITCWGGADSDVVSEYPTDTDYQDIDVGFNFACAIAEDTSLVCWGIEDGTKYDYGQVTDTPSTIGFVQVATGYYHACALDDVGEVTCWGSNEDGESEPPAGPFTALTAGEFFTCGLELDGTITCWGADGVGESSPPSGSFVQIDAGTEFSCGVAEDSTVECWGNSGGAIYPPAGSFVQVAGGYVHACGIQTDGYVQCWGLDNWGQSTPP